MIQRLFPKPPLAEPLPEEVWLKRTDRSEAGREPFFYGRDDEYEIFKDAVESLDAGVVGGGTMIFQGAPGAGKSALMLECMEAVGSHSKPEAPWVAVSIPSGSLKSPVDVVTTLVGAVNIESKRLLNNASDAVVGKFTKLLELGTKLFEDLSKRGVGLAGFSVGGSPESDSHMDLPITSGPVFANAAALLEKFHIVVFIDEAQNTPVLNSTCDVLDCLHRDSQGIPLVAVFFGLSDTEEVLRQCGLSRLSAERIVNLEPLSVEEAAGSLRRMMDSYYRGTDEQMAIWVTALANLSQGWPQHLNRVGVAAGKVIRSNNGKVEGHLLEMALEKGFEQKNDYYERRLAAGSNRPWVYRQLALAAGENRGQYTDTLSYDEIDLITENARKRKGESIDDFMSGALHAGLLAPARGLLDRYKIPIPSFAEYLRELSVEPPKSI